MSNVLAARFANSPVMVSRDKADWLSSCLDSVSTAMAQITARNTAEAATMYDDFWPMADSWMSYYRPYKVENGTLMIPVKGVLLHDFGYQCGDWATGYIYIQKAFERGMGDLNVQRIAMVMNSGGGEVAGCFDAVDRVFAMRGQKPIAALVNEHAYSAAYAWASVADKITVTRTGGVGSIGVVTSHTDYSKMLDERGIKITFIHAGDHKVDGNSTEPLPEAVKNRMQARIDGLYDIFVSTSARNLGIDEQIIRDTEALTYSAEEAVALGLAHEVRAFDEALTAFSGGLSITAGEETMSEATQTPEAIQAGLDAARAEGRKEGALAERERIQGIQGSDEAKARPTLASHIAMNTSMSIDEAKSLLAASAEEKKAEPEAAADAAKAPGADFAKAMGKNNPGIQEEGAEGTLTPGEQAIADYKAATGFGSN